MAKYLLTIVFLWLLVMLFYSPIPSDILEKDWEFPKELEDKKQQQNTNLKEHAVHLNLSPSDMGMAPQTRNQAALLCCYPPKP